MAENKNILTNAISDELMLQYIAGKLSPEDARKVEEAMASSEFIGDAAEGLANIETDKDISTMVTDLNIHLQSITQQQKKRLKKHKPLDINWVIISILVLAIVAVGGCMAIYFMLHHQ